MYGLYLAFKLRINIQYYILSFGPSPAVPGVSWGPCYHAPPRFNSIFCCLMKSPRQLGYFVAIRQVEPLIGEEVCTLWPQVQIDCAPSSETQTPDIHRVFSSKILTVSEYLFRLASALLQLYSVFLDLLFKGWMKQNLIMSLQSFKAHFYDIFFCIFC